MAIFAISDLHLSLSTDKPMDIFGPHWENYTERMRENWNRVVTPEDLVIIPGDISWAMYLPEAREDLAYIHSLNGEKLLLRGNHDYWWTTLNKMEGYLAQEGFSTLHILKNTAFIWEDTAVCGSRGWTIAGPGASEEDQRLFSRERQRILLSLEDAQRSHPKEILAAMHYPPVEKDSPFPGFLDLLGSYGVRECVFGHLHASSAHHFAPTGVIDGIRLHLVACDYVNFTPVLIKK